MRGDGVEGIHLRPYMYRPIYQHTTKENNKINKLRCRGVCVSSSPPVPSLPCPALGTTPGITTPRFTYFACSFFTIFSVFFHLFFFDAVFNLFLVPSSPCPVPGTTPGRTTVTFIVFNRCITFFILCLPLLKIICYLQFTY